VSDGEIDLSVRRAPIIRFGELAAFVDMLREKGFPDDTEVQVEAGDKMYWLSAIKSIAPINDGTQPEMELICTPQDCKWWKLNS
jgi:hypothetical protein